MAAEKKPYKIFCITDIHFGRSSNNPIKFKNFMEFFQYFIDYVRDHADKDDVCIFCGDLFENRNIADLKYMSDAFKAVRKLSKIVKTYLISGNHDQYEKVNPEHTCLDMFENDNKNITVVKSPTLIKGDGILMLPFYNDNSQFVDMANKYKSDNTNLLFCHAGFTGNSFFTGPDSECIDVNDVKSFEKVITGHIHARNIYKNIHFVGAPYQLDFSDVNFDRGFDVFSVNQDGHIVKDEFVKNTMSPKYIVRNIDTTEQFNDIIATCKNEFKGNYVKFIAGKEVDYSVMNKDLSFLEAISIDWSLKKDMALETSDSTEDSKGYVSLSDEVGNYINESNISSNAKKELISIVDEIFAKAGK